jgi:hypothetical protein
MFMANDQRVVDTYDNSVLYTDWFLHQVIDQVRALHVPARSALCMSASLTLSPVFMRAKAYSMPSFLMR